MAYIAQNASAVKREVNNLSTSLYKDYDTLRWGVWNSGEAPTVKMMALAILEYMKPSSLEASPSRRRIREMCGISENTLDKHWPTICRWIDITKARGKANVYRARVVACAAELIEMIPPNVPQPAGGGEARVPPVAGATPVGVPQVNGGGVPPITGGGTTPTSLGYSPPYKESNTNYPRREKIEDRSAGAREADDLVHVNGSAIDGPGFRLKYRDIELYSAQTGVPFEQSKLYAELAARRWAEQGFVPEVPSAAFGRALAKNKIHIQADAVRLQMAVDKLRAEQSAPQARVPYGTNPQMADKMAKLRAQFDGETSGKAV